MFRCKWIYYQIWENEELNNSINETNFVFPYCSTFQTDMLKLMKEDSDVLLQLPNNNTMQLHSWIVDLR